MNSTSKIQHSKSDFNTISVIGLGYIGLPTAAVFASRKKTVIGVDVNQDAIDTINRGEIHIVEPDLDMVVRATVTEGYLKATLEPEPADAFVIAVPTPFKDDHVPDLAYIQSACKAIAPVLEKGNLVVLESTSPVGATEQLSAWLAEERPDLSFPQQDGVNSDIRVAHCPERVLPGHVLSELVQNDRVIGGMSTKCSEMAVALYKTFVKGECIVTNARTAEMCKLTENSFRDVNIAFANELSMICDSLQINAWELIRLANRHPRVNILQPGPGVGGHCIAVDPWFIVSKTPEIARMIRTAREVNDHKPQWVIDKITARAERFKDPIIGCLGLTFKANIDDLRESPALEIVKILQEQNIGTIMACDVNVVDAQSPVPLSSLEDVLQKADIIVLLVDHDEFKTIDPELLKDKIIIDTRGCWR
ncbi:MAG: UDP-N-acetyl-D-mannosamine dehydrogenase [Candidatus Babeliaceae bacterium]|nr:UDP-N-acetyl-D-mannosamine dehydrogenase [Candidatus Babeliaceae bacterium]